MHSSPIRALRLWLNSMQISLQGWARTREPLKVGHRTALDGSGVCAAIGIAVDNFKGKNRLVLLGGTDTE